MKFVSIKKYIIAIFVYLTIVNSIDGLAILKGKNNKNNNKQILASTLEGIHSSPLVHNVPISYNNNNNSGLSKVPEITHFQNSNTSNLPDPEEYTKSPEINNPTIYLKKVEPISTVLNTPVHLGNKNVVNDITSIDKSTGITENHKVYSSIPILGNMQTEKSLLKETIQPYDLQYKRFRKPITTIKDNSDINSNI